MDNKTEAYPLIIAHRGFSDEAPENSMAAFRKAIDAGCDMIELDVRLSADNIPVVFHDRRLQRTSNGRGNLQGKSAAELAAIDNGSWFSPKFHRERIPLLRDIFPLLTTELSLNIEIKPDVTSLTGATVVESVVREIHIAKTPANVIVTSFNHAMVKEVKEVDRSIVTGVLYNPMTHFRKSPSTLIKNAKAEIFVCSKIQVNGDVVADTHEAGYRIYVYGVSTGRDIQRMLDLEVDGLICNNPRFVRETVDLLLKKQPQG